MHESAVVDPSNTIFSRSGALQREVVVRVLFFLVSRQSCPCTLAAATRSGPVLVLHCLLERLPVSVRLSREVGGWLRVLRLSEEDHLLDNGAY
jgi:hypothetical protein